MKQQLTALCLFLLMTITSVHTQTKSTTVDTSKFNGIWVFDAKASKADSETKERYKGQDLTITFSEPELKIIEPRTRNKETRYATLVFLTDGRGESNKPYAFNQDAVFESKTIWENDILVRRYAIPINLSGQPSGRMSYIEKYSLSEDGMTLTIITEFNLDSVGSKALLNKKSSSDKAEIIKRIYRKKQ